MKPMCIYIASRISAPSTELVTQVGGWSKLTPQNYVLSYIYNMRESIKAAANLWEKGHAVFMPAYDFLIYMEIDKVNPSLPYDADNEWIRRCDAILIVNGLDESKAVRAELEMALKHNKKVYYNVDDIPAATEKFE